MKTKDAILSVNSILFCALFVYIAMQLAPPAAHAQGTPTPTPTPTCTSTPTITPVPDCSPYVNAGCGPTPHPTPPDASPPPTPIPNDYQPHGHDGTNTVLYWREYVPQDGGSSWPTILILHEGDFLTGSIYSGQLEDIAAELSNIGYFVLIADYRLAPCGLIEGQTAHDESTQAGRDSGRPTQQIHDIKSLIAAARADLRCNGYLGVLGGSAGATHAAWVAIDQSVSTVWPVWNPAMRPDAVACLSGSYDFSDRVVPERQLEGFVEIIENYTDTCDPSEQRALSIVSLIANSPTDIKPMFVINSDNDTMPVHQMEDMRCALESSGVSSSLYRLMTVGPDNHHHAFQYWHDWDGITPVDSEPTNTVAGDVIAFFAPYLQP